MGPQQPRILGGEDDLVELRTCLKQPSRILTKTFLVFLLRNNLTFPLLRPQNSTKCTDFMPVKTGSINSLQGPSKVLAVTLTVSWKRRANPSVLTLQAKPNTTDDN